MRTLSLIFCSALLSGSAFASPLVDAKVAQHEALVAKSAKTFRNAKISAAAEEAGERALPLQHGLSSTTPTVVNSARTRTSASGSKVSIVESVHGDDGAMHDRAQTSSVVTRAKGGITMRTRRDNYDREHTTSVRSEDGRESFASVNASSHDYSAKLKTSTPIKLGYFEARSLPAKLGLPESVAPLFQGNNLGLVREVTRKQSYGKTERGVSYKLEVGGQEIPISNEAAEQLRKQAK
jgi:hypothetical protein